MEESITIRFLILILRFLIFAVTAFQVPLLDPVVGGEVVDDLLDSGENDDKGDEHGANDAVESGYLVEDDDLEGEGEDDAARLLHQGGLRGFE